MLRDHVLIIGAGGREHVISWKLSQSENVDKIYVALGNSGTAGVQKATNVSLNLKNHQVFAVLIQNQCKTFKRMFSIFL